MLPSAADGFVLAVVGPLFSPTTLDLGGSLVLASKQDLESLAGFVADEHAVPRSQTARDQEITRTPGDGQRLISGDWRVAPELTQIAPPQGLRRHKPHGDGGSQTGANEI